MNYELMLGMSLPNFQADTCSYFLTQYQVKIINDLERHIQIHIDVDCEKCDIKGQPSSCIRLQRKYYTSQRLSLFSCFPYTPLKVQYIKSSLVFNQLHQLDRYRLSLNIVYNKCLTLSSFDSFWERASPGVSSYSFSSYATQFYAVVKLLIKL